MLDPRERFSATADLYHRYRPSYPDAAIDWLLERAAIVPPAVIADIACGTGILTRLLAARGFDVTGIDPNAEMLRCAEELGGARYVRGEASATGLATRSVALATVAQAFHWFDVGSALRELGRVLRPEARCAVLWNVRSATPLLSAYDAVLARWSTEHAHAPRSGPTIAALERAPLVVGLERSEFANVQRLDRTALFGRAYSSSYVMHGVRDRAGFERDLDALFAAHASRGEVAFDYTTVVLSFRIAP